MRNLVRLDLVQLCVCVCVLVAISLVKDIPELFMSTRSVMVAY